MLVLPSFPAPCTAAAAYPVPVTRDLQLRPCSQPDLPFLRLLYGELRASELDQTGWPIEARAAFLDSQFSLQHRHFISYYAAADFWMVEHHGTAIGRYYLLRDPDHFLVVDIAVLPHWRGRGIGSTLLTWAQAQATGAGAHGIDLHVEVGNVDAHRLYTRLGFIETAREVPYIRMHWPARVQLNTA
ncbi:GNAT family N-acetyltransferase [Ralstonia sp. UBA689]|uniref:GNAT family N-acetyltransferase n=1 Tax=Ralstonia sp. UBA689 TaxID=1947373 RepID=UPI0025E3AC87|nr:GNAT family N-acetyltransferase [Ralstonia sp. UBA689]